MPGTSYQIEINPKVPQRLARLEELASNLWYSWDSPTRAMYSHLDRALWRSVGHSPKAFLKRVDQRRLEEAADDQVFLGLYHSVLSEYDTYHNEPARNNGAGLAPDDLIAYFCAEFGFHESLPLYSGGLGILAGDHCKAASDMRLPFVGVGLLYRQGYFHQTIDGQGNQRAVYTDSDFDDLPITPVTRDGGGELRVTVGLPGRNVQVKVWRVRAGHVMLYLLDTDLNENSAHDRGIAHRLYGGDRTTRIEQEIILGIGGVRALRELGLKPTVWHINEGHAAFLVLERVRALTREGLDFAAALEAVAAATIFTMHTAVPAGHDYFAADTVRHYFEDCCKDLRLGVNELLGLGQASESSEFNMTALAVRGSRFHSGVSRIHGRVSSRFCASLWPQIEPEENPIGHVTNAVHVPTFLATNWHDLFDRYLGHGWSRRLTDAACWSQVYSIPDHLFWSVRQALKSQMLYLIRHRIEEQSARNHGSEAHLDRLLRFVDPGNPNVLTIGFARRFATYKRATLLFQDLNRLREIMCDQERPVVIIMAGKAHPADQPGTDLIRRIAEVSGLPEFEGRLLLVEDYDLQLARRLVEGVDVWLNNPIYPMEASGTSGMKGAMNGVINLSVLDGWWAEAYDGKNGWAIKPATSAPDAGRRDLEEARTLYELLQDSVVPLYYSRGPAGHSPGWVAMAKHSLTSVLPRFNSTRMLTDYLTKYYVPAARQGQRYEKEAYSNARDVAAWKAKVRAAWDKVAFRRHDKAARRIRFGESIQIEVAVSLDGLAATDIVVELLLGRSDGGEEGKTRHYRLEHAGPLGGGTEHLFTLALTPESCGKLDYRIRVYPYHELLTHRFEMGMMRWL